MRKSRTTHRAGSGSGQRGNVHNEAHSQQHETHPDFREFTSLMYTLKRTSQIAHRVKLFMNHSCAVSNNRAWRSKGMLKNSIHRHTRISTMPLCSHRCMLKATALVRLHGKSISKHITEHVLQEFRTKRACERTASQDAYHGR